jgi:hypothetical protein
MKKEASMQLVLVVSLVGQSLGEAGIGGDIAVSVMGFVSAAMSNGIALIGGAMSKLHASKFLAQRNHLVAQKHFFETQSRRMQDEKAELERQLIAAKAAQIATPKKKLKNLSFLPPRTPSGSLKKGN